MQRVRALVFIDDCRSHPWERRAGGSIDTDMRTLRLAVDALPIARQRFPGLRVPVRFDAKYRWALRRFGVYLKTIQSEANS